MCFYLILRNAWRLVSEKRENDGNFVARVDAPLL